jgi:hypothetical protein
MKTISVAQLQQEVGLTEYEAQALALYLQNPSLKTSRVIRGLEKVFSGNLDRLCKAKAWFQENRSGYENLQPLPISLDDDDMPVFRTLGMPDSVKGAGASFNTEVEQVDVSEPDPDSPNSDTEVSFKKVDAPSPPTLSPHPDSGLAHALATSRLEHTTSPLYSVAMTQASSTTRELELNRILADSTYTDLLSGGAHFKYSHALASPSIQPTPTETVTSSIAQPSAGYGQIQPTYGLYPQIPPVGWHSPMVAGHYPPYLPQYYPPSSGFSHSAYPVVSTFPQQHFVAATEPVRPPRGESGDRNMRQGEIRNMRRDDRNLLHDETQYRPRANRDGDPKNLPKLVPYDGSSRWRDFAAQFQRFRRMLKWPQTEDSDRLALSLSGPALQFFETLAPQVKTDYRVAMRALERRFDRTLSTAGHRLRFQNLLQEDKETLQQFADRVRREALDAFPGMDADFVEESMSGQFLIGCSAKEAALQALQLRCRTLDDALDAVHRYIENQRTLMRPRPRNAQVMISSPYTEDHGSPDPAVQRATTPPSNMDLNKEIQAIKSSHASLAESMKTLQQQMSELLSSQRRSSSPGRGDRMSRSPSPRSRNCYECNKPGHFARDCPGKRLTASPPPQKHVSFKEDLNGRGSVQ